MNNVFFKASLILFVWLVSGESLIAQKSLRFKGGVSISNAQARVNFHDGNMYFDNLLRGYAGVEGEFKLNPFLSLVPELAYIGMGYGYNEEVYPTDNFSPARYHYLTLPVSVKYNANKYFGVFMGLYASYMIAGSDVTDSYTFETIPVSDVRKQFDFGLQLGAELLIYKYLGMGLRYSIGLFDIEKPYNDDYRIYNRSLQLYIFYQLTLKK